MGDIVMSAPLFFISSLKSLFKMTSLEFICFTFCHDFFLRTEKSLKYKLCNHVIIFMMCWYKGVFARRIILFSSLLKSPFKALHRRTKFIKTERKMKNFYFGLISVNFQWRLKDKYELAPICCR